MILKLNLKTIFASLFFLLLVFIFSPVQSAFADTFTLSGNVSESTGTDIENATIDVIDPSNSTAVASTTTNSEGNYTTIINGGTYNVQVTSPAGSNFYSAVGLSQNISVDFFLS